MEFIEIALSVYCENHTSPESDLLKKVNRDTNAEVLLPRMLSGHLQGRFLSFISSMIKPEKILEIGTYTGYSALCLAEGLKSSGKLITIDINAELEDRVRKYFDQSEYSKNITYIIGNALNIIPSLNEEFDLVFIDADKENNDAYFDLVIDKLKTGGFLLIDNVLWSGKVIAQGVKQDKDTQSILDFNTKIQTDKRLKNMLLPIRDGIMMVQKN